MKQAIYIPFNEDYAATADGKILTLKFGKQKALTPHYGTNGYMNVGLSKDGVSKTFTVHRLVAMCHVKNPNPKKFNIVNHIDGNKLNNKASNLEWTDHKGNAIHATKLPKKSKSKTPKVEMTDATAAAVMKFLFDEVDFDTFMKVASQIKG